MVISMNSLAPFRLASTLLLSAFGCGRTPAPPQSSSCPLPSTQISSRADDKSVTGDPLATCSSAPLTGWFRDGKCSTGADDTGVHVVCAQLTDDFLSFTKSQGNDLVSPRGAFPGLHAGQRWCLCASRWDEAERAGVAPPVVLEATHDSAMRIVDAAKLKTHAVGRP